MPLRDRQAARIARTLRARRKHQSPAMLVAEHGGPTVMAGIALHAGKPVTTPEPRRKHGKNIVSSAKAKSDVLQTERLRRSQLASR